MGVIEFEVEMGEFQRERTAVVLGKEGRPSDQTTCGRSNSKRIVALIL